MWITSISPFSSHKGTNYNHPSIIKHSKAIYNVKWGWNTQHVSKLLRLSKQHTSHQQYLEKVREWQRKFTLVFHLVTFIHAQQRPPQPPIGNNQQMSVRPVTVSMYVIVMFLKCFLGYYCHISAVISVKADLPVVF